MYLNPKHLAYLLELLEFLNKIDSWIAITRVFTTFFLSPSLALFLSLSPPPPLLSFPFLLILTLALAPNWTTGPCKYKFLLYLWFRTHGTNLTACPCGSTGNQYKLLCEVTFFLKVLKSYVYKTVTN